MLKKEQLLKILKKYGFYSLNRAPYLYQNKEQSGIYFVWPNKHYGNLERVLYFNELEEAEEEVFKYWWFLNHKDTMLIEVELEDYEKLNPHVHYLYKNTILTANMMKSLEQDDTAIISHKESIKKKQLFRTASIIISILKEKFKLQNETYFKVLEMQENLKQLNNEYNKLLTKYKKAQEEVPESYELLHDEQDDSEELVRVLYSDLEQLSSVEEIREFISNLFGYLINLDTSEVHLQNIYLLNRYPYEIALMEQKNTILKDALKEKKKLFKSKTDAMQLIKEAEDKSECTHMINVNVYIEKEKKRIQEKYMFQNEIDEVVLGDYLANFENMSVELPPIIEDKTTSTLFSKEELLEQIRNQYTNLKKQEKTACIVANSFLSPCLEILQTIPEYESSSISEIISQLVLNQKLDIFNSCYATLDYYANAKIRVKYLSMVKTDTFEKFLLSLIEVLLVLKKIRMEVDATFYGYYHNKERKILPISLKNIPFYKNTCSYIGEIKEHTPIYYSPVAIIRNIDILDTNELVVRENESVYLLTERVQFTTLDSSCSVVKYAKDKVSKKKDFIVIENMKEKEKYIYYSDIITERKDGDQNE